jgi:hypothetical protein
MKDDVAGLRELLKEVGDDPILGPQFRARLEEAEQTVRLKERNSGRVQGEEETAD